MMVTEVMPQSTYKLLWLALNLSFNELELMVYQAEIGPKWILGIGGTVECQLG